EHGTAFVYVLPFNAYEALIEYTLFTGTLLEPSQYDLGLRNYIGTYIGTEDYEVTEEEFGIIPMTNERFDFYKDGIYHIGTAGGQTKASSGYTFQFIQKQADAIVKQLEKDKSLQQISPDSSRF